MKQVMSPKMIRLWNALCDIEPPDVPLEAIRQLIEECRCDRQIESELVERLRLELEKAKDPNHFDVVLWWLIIILGEAKSEKALPHILQCFELENYDYVYELCEKMLCRIGEKAAKAVMEWLDRDPAWDTRIYGYTVLEDVVDYGDPSFLSEVKEFLKKRVLFEEGKPPHDEWMEPALQSLAYFPGEDVLKFVRNVYRRYEYNPELNAALEIAEGRFEISRKNDPEESWEEICKRYARRATPDAEKEEIGREESLERLSKKIRGSIQAGRWEEALPMAIELKKQFPRQWAGPDFLASCYNALGRIEEAKKETQEALSILHRRWKILPQTNDYQDIERLERKADLILGRGPIHFASRAGDYTEGLLINIGALKFNTALQTINKFISAQKDISKEEITAALHQDPRFQFFEDCIALSDVEDVALLVQETNKRKLSPLLPESLTKIKLLQEGRISHLYEDWEDDADKDIRIFTEGKWNLESVRRVIRKDVTGRRNTDWLSSQMRIYSRDFPELVEIINAAWNKTTRWELGGRTPDEVFRHNPNAEDNLPPHVHITSFPKVGRNDSCPCGSGKKFKKCCSDKEQTR